MQRKNYILKHHGMAMIMAIFMILVLGGIMAAVVSLTSTTTQRTQNQYLHEQALLLTRSATEYAMLAISGHTINAANGCINQITAVYPNAANPMFDITINARYVLNAAPATCNVYIPAITAQQTNGTVLLDVYVNTDAALNLDEPIRYHRRTLQKL
ncbi:MAG: type II secretion system protein [Sulfuricurvum sp.]|nr:type II secretion system protein [Sulfuricurvum sp.]